MPPRAHRWLIRVLALAVSSVGAGCGGGHRTTFPFVAEFTQNPADPDYIERCYRVLTDDHAGAERWAKALAYIALPDHAVYDDGWGVFFPKLEDGQTIGLAGEFLRARTNRSVTELASQRIRELEDDDVPASELCSMTLDLATWDVDGALPVARHQMARAIAEWSKANDDWAQQQLANCIGDLAVARYEADGPDPDALEDYADWIVRTSARTASYDSFTPVWAYPEWPAMAEVAEDLFEDPESSRVPLLFPDDNHDNPTYPSILETPLVDLPSVRRQLRRELALDNVVGEFRVQQGRITVAPDFRCWHTGSYWTFLEDIDPKDPRRARLRRRGVVPYREFLAWMLAQTFDEIEFGLHWKPALREAAIVEIDARLRDARPLFEAECADFDDSPVCRYRYAYRR